MIRATSRDGYLGVVAAFMKLDIEDRIGRIKAPTLFIGGAEDKIAAMPASSPTERTSATSGSSRSGSTMRAHAARCRAHATSVPRRSRSQAASDSTTSARCW